MTDVRTIFGAHGPTNRYAVKVESVRRVKRQMIENRVVRQRGHVTVDVVYHIIFGLFRRGQRHVWFKQLWKRRFIVDLKTVQRPGLVLFFDPQRTVYVFERFGRSDVRII